MDALMIQGDKKIHFGALDSLRTYAFLIVFISHAYFSFFAVTDDRTTYFAHGEIGVHIFFVLSAFLITFLSIREVREKGNFSILHFFKKRVLRIWPLYFLALAISYIWLLLSAPMQKLECTTQFIYFLGNICVASGMPDIIGTTTVTPLWSVSVEQQFYTLFPFLLVGVFGLLKYFKKIYVQSMVVILLTLTMAYALVMRYIHAENWHYISYTTVSSLPGFIIGILLAYLMYTKNGIVNHIRKNKSIYAVLSAIFFVSAFFIKFTGHVGVSLYILLISLVTSVFIILKTDTAATGDMVTPPILSRALQYLGKISYGLYVYHMFAIVFLQFLNLPVHPLISSILALSLTVFLAHISYRYFESWFLKFK